VDEDEYGELVELYWQRKASAALSNKSFTYTDLEWNPGFRDMRMAKKNKK